MDEWYLSRWATGSSNSRWPDLVSCFREVYNSERPIGEIYAPTLTILALFDSLEFKSTFFFTGLIASYYPDLVKLIAAQGHEIACHNYYHLDYEYEPRDRFYQDLITSKKLLEDLSGKEVIGYRSPNSSYPQSLVEDLERAGFKYDSSITPTRRLFGKFGPYTQAPHRPYRPSYQNIGLKGNAMLWEFPWTVFPILKLPAGSGNMHRIGGDLYNTIATYFALKYDRITSYYFHPFELQHSEFMGRFINLNLKTRIFHLRIGMPYYKSLQRFLHHHRNLLTSGAELLAICTSGRSP